MFCNQSPNLNTAFPQKCAAGRSGPGPLPVPGWDHCGYHSSRGWSWGGFEGRAPQGCSCKEEEGKKGQKYPESWVYNWPCLSVFFMWAQASGEQQKRLHPQAKPYTFTLCGSLLLGPTVCGPPHSPQDSARDCQPGLQNDDLVLIGGTCRRIIWGKSWLRWRSGADQVPQWLAPPRGCLSETGQVSKPTCCLPFTGILLCETVSLPFRWSTPCFYFTPECNVGDSLVYTFGAWETRCFCSVHPRSPRSTPGQEEEMSLIGTWIIKESIVRSRPVHERTCLFLSCTSTWIESLFISYNVLLYPSFPVISNGQ